MIDATTRTTKLGAYRLPARVIEGLEARISERISIETAEDRLALPGGHRAPRPWRATSYSTSTHWRGWPASRSGELGWAGESRWSTSRHFHLKETPQRLRSYIRVDPGLADRKKKAKYPDGAFAAFVEVLCAAEHQPHRGRFQTMAILRAYLAPRARWIAFLIEKKDLLVLADGVLYVDGWDEWQEGDWKVAERMKRIRERQRQVKGDTPVVTPTDTVTDTPTDTVENVSGPSEPLAVSGRRLAVSASQVVRYLNPGDDPVLQLQLWWQEFRGGQISEHDKQAASVFVIEYPRLGLNGIEARIIEYAAWRVEHKKPPLGKLEFYRDTLREQEAHLADTGVQRPRESRSAGMERVGEVLAQ